MEEKHRHDWKRISMEWKGIFHSTRLESWICECGIAMDYNVEGYLWYPAISKVIKPDYNKDKRIMEHRYAKNYLTKMK